MEANSDYTLIYSKFDKEAAYKIHNILQACGINGQLYTPAINITDSQFKLFLVSENIEEGERFERLKYKAVHEDITFGEQSVIPIWLTPKKDISRKLSRMLYGLMSIQGLNPHSKHFISDIKKLFKKDGD